MDGRTDTTSYRDAEAHLKSTSPRASGSLSLGVHYEEICIADYSTNGIYDTEWSVTKETKETKEAQHIFIGHFGRSFLSSGRATSSLSTMSFASIE